MILIHDPVGVQALKVCVVNQGLLYTFEPPLLILKVAVHTIVFPVAAVSGPIHMNSIVVLIMLTKEEPLLTIQLYR